MAARNTPALLLLERTKTPHKVHEYELSEGGKTYGEAVAATLGVDPARLFKTLVAEVDGRHVVGIVPTSGSLSLKALSRAAGGKQARLADPVDAERLTGYVTGGISPLGQKRRLQLFADASLELHETVFVSAGQRGLQVELAPTDLVRLADCTLVADLAG